MSKWACLLRSRKFWASIAGIVFTLITHFVPDFPLDQPAIEKIVLLIAAYIIGTGLDNGQASPTPST